ncbi:hypothetical protein [Cohnella fermenti]|uniref:Uncharacterized protein n=1 Tax=Cohnella fermenti TaxID=2565925 RepID=A0A4S4BSH5_9BACL|nr:hypothetical protein [Cohnella fermenti]THF77996.1 hypothetical protein E6C55_14925 [Cohnella fermenti]
MVIRRPLMRQLFSVACGASLLLALAGCSNYSENFQKSAKDYSSRLPGDPKMSRVQSYGSYRGLSTSRNSTAHDNVSFRYSSQLSYDVKTLPGVNSAIVMLAGQNAYVGIMTDWTATGTKSHGGADTREQDNTGTTEGVYNVDTGGRTPVYREMVTPYNSYFSHKDVSDLSSEFKQTIGSAVRKNHPEIEEVHISANREFVNQLLLFARASWSGEDTSGLTGDFNKLMKYMFSQGKDIPTPLGE